MAKIDFIIGGIRSGKSAFAEKLTLESALSGGAENLHYIATAEVIDDAMRQRIEKHRQRRQAQNWRLHEEALAIDKLLRELDKAENIVLLDSLDMWVNNLLHHAADRQAMTAAFLSAAADFRGRLIAVSAEVGLSLVPANAEAAEFCDAVGELNQSMASLAERVIWTVAGLPYCLKGSL